ncbi:MAG: hypothetical protein Q4D04_10320 [Clostridia bacterium]|nr:hypothetical protein [Clostridia bacterium]
MVECAHCGDMRDSREMTPCETCNALLCPDCSASDTCPDGERANIVM